VESAFTNKKSMKTHHLPASLAATAMVAAITCTPSIAGETPAPPAPAPEKPSSLCDDLWSHAVLYKNKENPVIQEFALQGRFQVQYAVGDSDQGSFSSGDLQDLGTPTWEDVDVRRWYMGFKSTLFHDLKIQGHAVINADWGPVYNSLYDLYATYGVNDQLQINAGKIEVKFTKEFEVSSKEIVTLERSLLVNQLSPGLITGAWINGKDIAGPWFYELGIYAADVQQEFTEFQGGALTLAKLGYDLSKATGLEKSAVGLHWMHSTKPGEAGAKSFGDSFSLAGEVKQGRWAAIGDIMYGIGDGTQPDAWGFSVIPTYDITDKLQVVGRYQFASSDGDNGLNLQSRYERTAEDFIAGTSTYGDQYQAAYLGLNYYLCGHKLKLMTGVEYANMQDDANDGGEFDGWTWTTGLRMYF
jgi:phosphate-selective porin OprO/OprP